MDFGSGRIGYSPNLELDFAVLFFDEGGVGTHPSDEWMESNVYETEWGGVAWRSYVYPLDPPEFPLCSYQFKGDVQKGALSKDMRFDISISESLRRC